MILKFLERNDVKIEQINRTCFMYKYKNKTLFYSILGLCNYFNQLCSLNF